METDLQPVEAPSFEAVVNRAIEVIGDPDAAMRWLGTPIPALDYSTPIALMSIPNGRLKVIATLTRLEHGVM
jgi:putative toxin-antitoxin system antitoxin component (TIGR02293 family)